MTRALRTLFTAVAALGLSATLSAQTARLTETDRDRLLPLAEQLSTQVAELARQASGSPGYRSRVLRGAVTELQTEAAAFRAAILRNRPIDVSAEVQGLRDSLTRVQDNIHPRRTPDASLRQTSANLAGILDRLETETASLGSSGKAVARFEPGRYADVDNLDQLATTLVEHSARLRDLAHRNGRTAPAVAHFDDQVRQLHRVLARSGEIDIRPHVQRLQGDLNAALRELRRQRADEATFAEWEWADGLLERMSDVGRASVTRAVPNELLGLAHELHVQTMKAEEFAKAAGRSGPNLARLGDHAYTFHHEMHDGRLSWLEAQDRVELALRTFQRADAEVRAGAASAELRAEWTNVQATLQKMRTLMGV
jgi:hypothetical protein